MPGGTMTDIAIAEMECARGFLSDREATDAPQTETTQPPTAA